MLLQVQNHHSHSCLAMHTSRWNWGPTKGYLSFHDRICFFQELTREQQDRVSLIWNFHKGSIYLLNVSFSFTVLISLLSFIYYSSKFQLKDLSVSGSLQTATWSYHSRERGFQSSIGPSWNCSSETESRSHCFAYSATCVTLMSTLKDIDPKFLEYTDINLTHII